VFQDVSSFRRVPIRRAFNCEIGSKIFAEFSVKIQVIDIFFCGRKGMEVRALTIDCFCLPKSREELPRISIPTSGIPGTHVAATGTNNNDTHKTTLSQNQIT
jgi:hypothetical protein